MEDRGKILKKRQQTWGLKAREIHEQVKDLSIDTIRKLGFSSLSVDSLDKIERGMELARQQKAKLLQVS